MDNGPAETRCLPAHQQQQQHPALTGHASAACSKGWRTAAAAAASKDTHPAISQPAHPQSPPASGRKSGDDCINSGSGGTPPSCNNKQVCAKQQAQQHCKRGTAWRGQTGSACTSSRVEGMRLFVGIKQWLEQGCLNETCGQASGRDHKQHCFVPLCWCVPGTRRDKHHCGSTARAAKQPGAAAQQQRWQHAAATGGLLSSNKACRLLNTACL